MSETAIAVRNFRKSYGGVSAVHGISFDVRAGEIFGLLGPNGAGKTSTLESIEGLRTVDGGSITVCGIDAGSGSKRLYGTLGVQLQTSGLPETMTAEEALRFFSLYHRVRYDLRILERLGLAESRRKKFKDLSTGQQRRLALALSIAHRPRVLILDEPTAGLDVATRAELHAIMRELREGGTAILLATHDMAEAEALADRIAILLNGTIAVTGTPREVTSAGNTSTKVSVRTGKDCFLDAPSPLPSAIWKPPVDRYAVCFSERLEETLPALLRHIAEMGDVLVDLRVERPSLEERFLEITGNGGNK
jgi:ABC-2 type transport system ATP-binding protein